MAITAALVIIQVYIHCQGFKPFVWNTTSDKCNIHEMMCVETRIEKARNFPGGPGPNSFNKDEDYTSFGNDSFYPRDYPWFLERNASVIPSDPSHVIAYPNEEEQTFASYLDRVDLNSSELSCQLKYKIISGNNHTTITPEFPNCRDIHGEFGNGNTITWAIIDDLLLDLDKNPDTHLDRDLRFIRNMYNNSLTPLKFQAQVNNSILGVEAWCMPPSIPSDPEWEHINKNDSFQLDGKTLIPEPPTNFMEVSLPMYITLMTIFVILSGLAGVATIYLIYLYIIEKRITQIREGFHSMTAYFNSKVEQVNIFHQQHFKTADDQVQMIDIDVDDDSAMVDENILFLV